MNKSVVVNGIKFIPLRHIAIGQAYINPEDLEKLLKWIDETNRNTKIFKGDDYDAEAVTAYPYDKDNCTTCGRSQCFGGTICFNLGEEAYNR
jgi:hypothetical protein